MSNADRVLLSYAEEPSFGGSVSALPMIELRITGESLKGDTSTTNSEEIRDDRQIQDVVRTSVGVSGDVNFELSYGTFDDILEFGLYSAGWSSAVATITADVNCTFAANTITLGAGTWDTTPSVGSWIQVSGATDDTTNNGIWKVTAASTTVITVEQTLSAQVETGAVTITEGAAITNGTTQSSITLERKYADLTNVFETFVGCVISTLSTTVAADSIITGSFGVMGKTAASASASPGDTSYTASPQNTIINSIDHVTRIDEAAGTQAATSLSFNVNNNVRARPQIASLGPISFGEGAVEVSGTLQSYFSSSTLYDKYLNFTESSLAIIATDTDGNAYVFDFPAIRYTSGQRVAGSGNSDIIADLQWSAFREDGEDKTMRVVRFPTS